MVLKKSWFRIKNQEIVEMQQLHVCSSSISKSIWNLNNRSPNNQELFLEENEVSDNPSSSSCVKLDVQRVQRSISGTGDRSSTMDRVLQMENYRWWKLSSKSYAHQVLNDQFKIWIFDHCILLKVHHSFNSNKNWHE